MFMQGDRSLERTRAGLGVGLTLVRNLVALHGGTVDAHSEGIGTGSEFTVKLPLDPRAQPARPHADAFVPADHTKALRILVAEDNDDGREMLEFFLTGDGHTVTAVADGAAVLRAAPAFQPDVVILDIGLPEMNGYAAAAALRKQSGNPIPVLAALSGLGQLEDKARAAQAGFDRHFTKPVDVNALRAFLATISPVARRDKR
jgi:CheY-like chemotaxis protein